MNGDLTLNLFQGIFTDCPRVLSIEAYFCRLLLLKSYVFWDVTPCIPLKINWSFGGTWYLHLQDRRISQARNQREAGNKQSSDLLFFNPEDGGYLFLRNVGWLSTDYTALYPRRWNPSLPPLWKPQIILFKFRYWYLVNFVLAISCDFFQNP
jgi:hypothetical protein